MNQALQIMKEYLVSGPVKPEMISSLIKEASELKDCGGHDIFLGQVRGDTIDGKRVVAIEYSAYEPMVSMEAEKIRNEILSEFSDVRSAVILHSSGIVKTGEISLFVLVSAGHRLQAINGCRETVERIKARLPLWKKEIFADDTYRWKDNKQVK